MKDFEFTDLQRILHILDVLQTHAENIFWHTFLWITENTSHLLYSAFFLGILILLLVTWNDTSNDK